MRARYVGTGYGRWKGLDVFPGAELEIPAELAAMVSVNANFEVIEEKRGPGRPPKVAHGNAA